MTCIIAQRDGKYSWVVIQSGEWLSHRPLPDSSRKLFRKLDAQEDRGIGGCVSLFV
jgi:hypothetical protein